MTDEPMNPLLQAAHSAGRTSLFLQQEDIEERRILRFALRKAPPNKALIGFVAVKTMPQSELVELQAPFAILDLNDWYPIHSFSEENLEWCIDQLTGMTTVRAFISALKDALGDPKSEWAERLGPVCLEVMRAAQGKGADFSPAFATFVHSDRNAVLDAFN